MTDVRCLAGIFQNRKSWDSVGIFDVTTNHLTRGCVQKWEDGYPEKL
jgi:hypothetical protein